MLMKGQKSKANDSAVSAIADPRKSTSINFGDTQDLRVIADKLFRLEHVLGTNIKICRRLTNIGDLAGIKTTSSSLGSNLCLDETELQRDRILALQKRLSSSSDLVCTAQTLDLGQPLC